MKALKEYVEESLKLPMDMLLPEGIELFPLDNQVEEKAYLFGNSQALKRVYLLQSEVGRFFGEGREGLFYIGLWSHGSNSGAYYWCSKKGNDHIFLRLHTGGWYTPWQEQAKLISNYLLNFFDFQKKIEGRIKKQEILESMGSGWYRFTCSDGRVIELEESLFKNPDFEGLLKKILGE